MVSCQRKMTSKPVAQTLRWLSLPIQKVSSSEESVSPWMVLMIGDCKQSSRFTEGSVTDILAGDIWEVKSGTALSPVRMEKLNQVSKYILSIYVLFHFLNNPGDQNKNCIWGNCFSQCAQNLLDKIHPSSFPLPRYL